MRLEGEEMVITDRHIDVYDERSQNRQQHTITKFVDAGLGKRPGGEISIKFSCHSEVGGRYEFEFSKGVIREKSGFKFHHRKLVSAKYPWKEKPILFTDDA